MVTLIPPSEPIAVNKIHSWQIRLTSMDGKPITQASFKIEGGMPQHNHGMPTRPQVTQHLGHGTYLLEGMKFNMPGAWEIKLQIQTEKEKDSAHFPIQIELPPAIKAPGAHAASASSHSKDAK